MITTSKRRLYAQRTLSKINAKRIRENNQQKCIDCLKPRSIKNELNCKKYGCNKFYESKITENFYSQYY